MTLRIDRLEKDGLIRRERDPQDRRVVHSRLTDEGLSVIDELFAVPWGGVGGAPRGTGTPEQRPSSIAGRA